MHGSGVLFQNKETIKIKIPSFVYKDALLRDVNWKFIVILRYIKYSSDIIYAYKFT